MRNRVEDFHGQAQKQSPRVVQESAFLDQISASLQKPLEERFEIVKKMIDELSIKDLHILYPHLLASIFNFSRSQGWALHSPYSRHLEPLQHFLGPRGPVWRLVQKLERDTFLQYEFPITCLPRPTQLLFVEGVIPALYYNKVQVTGGSQTPLVITLGAVEYFLFQFSYFITRSSSEMEARPSERSHDTLYTVLLADYLEYFLPTNVSFYRSDQVPTSYPGAGVKGFFRGPGSESQLYTSTPFSGLIKSFEHQSSAYVAASYDQSSQTLQSEMFFQILIELWLNHTVDKEGTKTFSPFGADFFLPSVDHVRVVRMLVKHLHLFMNVNVNFMGGTFTSEISEDFYRSFMPESLKLFKKKLFWFIHHCFAHWPLDPSFRFILETWLSYIQPWRYITSEPTRSRDGRGIFSQYWKPFLRNNLLFYTSILQEFLNRARKLNLRSSRDTQLFYRVTKVYSQDPLMPIICEVERELISCLSSNHSRFGQRPRSPKSAQYSHFLELQTPGVVYQPLFMEQTVYTIRLLVRHVEETLRSLREPQCRDSPADPPGASWLSTRIRGAINWLQDVCSIDEHYWLIQDESRKAQEHLGHVCRQLKKLFQIQDDELERTLAWASEVGEGSSVSCARARVKSTETQPDCVQTDHGMVPTALGKFQMANGLRRFDIQYSGDPDLQPVRSYEAVFLVRTLYRLSAMLNEKFGPQLSLLYHSPRWPGSLARHLSPGVQQPRALTPVKQDAARAPCTPGRPKISLRYLASYRLWAQLLLLLFFVSCVLGNTLLAVLTVLFVLFAMFVRNIHATRRPRERRSSCEDLFTR